MDAGLLTRMTWFLVLVLFGKLTVALLALSTHCFVFTELMIDELDLSKTRVVFAALDKADGCAVPSCQGLTACHDTTPFLEEEVVPCILKITASSLQEPHTCSVNLCEVSQLYGPTHRCFAARTL